MTPAQSDARPPRLLYIDSDAAGCPGLNNAISRRAEQGWCVTTVQSGREGLNCLRDADHNLIFAELNSLGDLGDSPEAGMARLVKLAGDALVIAVCSNQSVTRAVAALRAGAHDYVAKPVDAQALHARIEDLTLRHGRKNTLCNPVSCPDPNMPLFLVGESSHAQFLVNQVKRIAASSAPVLLSGEEGTGKAACAHYLHAQGPRADTPFETIDCTTTDAATLDAQLFGVAPGAMSNGSFNPIGALERADTGTIFLSNIHALNPSLQTKLLRFMQTDCVTRLGEGVARPIDVRVIAASNAPLLGEVTTGRFREDLYYRLQVLPISLPSLAQRAHDIVHAANWLLARMRARNQTIAQGLTQEARDILTGQSWGRNFSALEKSVCAAGKIAKSRLLHGADFIDLNAGADTPDNLVNMHHTKNRGQVGHAVLNAPKILPMWRQEQMIIEEALAAFDGNIGQAATALEISPSTIYRKKQSWDEMEAAQDDAHAGAA